jgi:hypothetical protein
MLSNDKVGLLRQHEKSLQVFQVLRSFPNWRIASLSRSYADSAPRPDARPEIVSRPAIVAAPRP